MIRAHLVFIYVVFSDKKLNFLNIYKMDIVIYSNYSIRKKQFLNEIKTSLVIIDFNKSRYLKNYFKYLNACVYCVNDVFTLAAGCDQLSIVKFLIMNGSNINNNDDCALRLASFRRFLSVVKFLVFNGANIHVENNYMLKWSICNSYLSLAKFLIKSGADVYSRSINRWAIRNNLLPTVNYFKRLSIKN